MNVRNYLNQVAKLDKIIQNKVVEKEQWMAMATSTSASTGSGERVQSSGSQQKMSDAVIKIIEIQDEIDKYICRLVEAKKEVVNTIEMLPLDEYDLLHKVYIQFKDLPEAAEMMGKSYSWATTVHGRALKHVQNILDERGSAT